VAPSNDKDSGGGGEAGLLQTGLIRLLEQTKEENECLGG
jgi:hypothetical protein